MNRRPTNRRPASRRKKLRKRAANRSRSEQDNYPGWVWMLFGLAIGLSVAFAIYVKDNEPASSGRTAALQPASMAETLARSTSVDDAATKTGIVEEPPKERFDFYEMLPNFEIIIPEQETDVSPDTTQKAVILPGVYVLQAGSFGEFSDADRRRAQLALQGVESRIQKVTIDDRTYHRVRIGPTRDLDKLNRIRRRLKQANIDVLRIRLGD